MCSCMCKGMEVLVFKGQFTSSFISLVALGAEQTSWH